jgi:hypothetical protein
MQDFNGMGWFTFKSKVLRARFGPLSTPRVCFVCRETVGKPDAGNPHVRFDEEEQGDLLLTLPALRAMLLLLPLV